MLIYAKPIPFPLDVFATFSYSFSMFPAPGSAPSGNLHTYAMIMFIYINMDFYVSYLQSESLNEEGSRGPAA